MINEFITHQIVISVIIASFICQTWKFIDKSVRKNKLYWYGFVATGGMPSSHSTFVSALAVGIGLVDGFVSTTFFVAAGFAIIVIRDAFGVRRTVDALTKTVNVIIKEKKLGIKEILKITGHTPVQAVVGIIIGVVVPIVVNHFY